MQAYRMKEDTYIRSDRPEFGLGARFLHLRMDGPLRLFPFPPELRLKIPQKSCHIRSSVVQCSGGISAVQRDFRTQLGHSMTADLLRGGTRLLPRNDTHAFLVGFICQLFSLCFCHARTHRAHKRSTAASASGFWALGVGLFYGGGGVFDPRC